jgi:hypothetical protein
LYGDAILNFDQNNTEADGAMTKSIFASFSSEKEGSCFLSLEAGAPPANRQSSPGSAQECSR